MYLRFILLEWTHEPCVPTAVLKAFTGKFRPNGFFCVLKFALYQVEEVSKLDALCNINPQILAHSGIYTELCPQASNNTKMKIFAVGMNYAQHNLTLHEQADRPETPVIFTKCDTALLKDGKPFFIPDHLGSIEYEAELVVRICKLGKTIPVRFAHRYYDAVTVGIDFTARDLQKKLREAGQPWDLCKGFDGSAVLGAWVSTDKTKPVQQLRFRLDVNGKPVQEGYSRAICSSRAALQAADLCGLTTIWRAISKTKKCWHSIVNKAFTAENDRQRELMTRCFKRFLVAMLPLLSLNAQASQRFFNLTYDQVRIDSVLPRFTYSLPLSDNYADSVYQVSIVYPEFTEMSRTEVARYKRISDAPLPAMPAIRQFVSFDRKRPTLVVSFLPLVFRDGRYSILASFMLKVESFATAHAKPLCATVRFGARTLGKDTHTGFGRLSTHRVDDQKSRFYRHQQGASLWLWRPSATLSADRIRPDSV